MRFLKMRFMIGGVVLMVLSLILYFVRDMNHALFILTGIGAVIFVIGIIMN